MILGLGLIVIQGKKKPLPDWEVNLLKSLPLFREYFHKNSTVPLEVSRFFVHIYFKSNAKGALIRRGLQPHNENNLSI